MASLFFFTQTMHRFLSLGARPLAHQFLHWFVYLTSLLRSLRHLKFSLSEIRLVIFSLTHLPFQCFICGKHYLISYKSQKPRNQSSYYNRFFICIQTFFVCIPPRRVFKNSVFSHWSKFFSGPFFPCWEEGNFYYIPE